MKKIGIIILFLVTLLSACDTNGGTVDLSINETAAEITETTNETIRMNNCGGKADSEQSVGRSKSVQIEGGGIVGVDGKVVNAQVSAKYGEVTGYSKSQKLIAPPGTNMEFMIQWTEKTWVGVVTSQGKDGQSNYKVSVPISVELISSQDIGCNNSATAESLTNLISLTPTSKPATETPQVVNTPTQLPTEPPVADTAPSSILDVGQEWRQNGVGLRLTKFNFDPDDSYYYGVNVGFEFRNYTDTNLILSFTDNDFLAFTNAGESLNVRGFYNRSFWCPETTAEVKAGGYFSLEVDVCSNTKGYLLNIEVDLANPNLSEVIIHVTRLSRITDAKWRVQVNR